MTRSLLRRAWLLGGALLLTSCGNRQTAPEGQLLLYLNTDAPLPAAPGGTLGTGDPVALFDRVRIDVIRPGESTPCEGCTHEFDLDRELVGQGRASAGITTPVGAGGYVARVRLFRASFVELGEPRPDATLETVVALPAVEPEGVHAITVMLHTDDVAHPVGTIAAPVSPLEGPATPGVAGTWPSARRVPCAGAAQPGEVCVPGGAYWMGDPVMRLTRIPGDPIVLRIAVVSPFYLDAAEVTVAAFRGSGLATKSDPLVGTNDGAQTAARCTFSVDIANHEGFPLTCISWSRARAFCNLRGADLPTEAQFQYAASHLGTSRFVWGNDEPSCDDAVYDRIQGNGLPEESCPGFGVAIPGSGRRDRLALPGGEIVDLAGNATEYAQDEWNLSSELCWATGVAHDPVCTTQSRALDYDAHTVVGGWWYAAPPTLAAAMRQPSYDYPAAVKGGANGGPLFSFAAAATGFRCARSATE